MGTFAYGEAAAFALARAMHEQPDNSYVKGRACWRLRDVGTTWIGSYARTRDNGEVAIAEAASRYGCKSQTAGSNMLVYSQSMMSRALKKFASRKVEPGKQWACYIIDPSPDLVLRALRMSKGNSGIVMALSETIAAVAFRVQPTDAALRAKVVLSAGRCNRYAPTHILDCTESRTALREDHFKRILEDSAADRKAAEVARIQLAQRFPFRATVSASDLRSVKAIVSGMPRSHGWSGRDLFLTEKAATIVAKTVRVVRHKESTAAA